MKLEPHNNGDATRERILDEAERLFAQKGYDAVTVREITSAAGAHLAAVNYHFSNKENLYLEVFRSRWMQRALKMRQPLLELEQRDDFTAEDVVRTLARAFLAGDLTAEQRQRHSLLASREMGNQSGVFKLLAQESMVPFMDLVVRLWQRCLPRPMAVESLELIALSIFSQVLYFNFARPAVSLVTGREYDTEFVEQLVDHITNFALHGLNGDETQ
ncbi:MAG: CerR family C-terminal domain-containing protein [Desulfarculaceae bacterium]|nr:CerR family C-terminal domain-containing protein [Desulfarculaceae bacterium]MCF8071738.1 CerR family C-terminal domain-containing protein [Desulfarculaceae bacterium]MCF8102415.1 CerR family C-terminal domain-containing protein [Desulfarculaceae bacterium]MCF8116757.1 CerR family C-terminal domain-containing protein [Desulfarculaceae bacterium]